MGTLIMNVKTFEEFTTVWRRHIEQFEQLSEQAGSYGLWPMMRRDLLTMMMVAADKEFPLDHGPIMSEQS
jgi:hypothetical protein